MTKKNTHTYKPTTEYEKNLRSFTIKDTARTLIITLVLFGIQAAIFYAYQQGMLTSLLPQ